MMDVPGSADSVKRKFDDKQAGVRTMRGAIDAIVRAMHGAEARVSVEPAGEGDALPPAWDASATGIVRWRRAAASRWCWADSV